MLVVHDAAAAANPALRSIRLGVTASGLSVAADTAGNLTATDATGHARFTAATPLMWDSGTADDLTGSAKTSAQEATTAGGAPATSSAAEPGAAAKISEVGAKYAAGALTLTPPAAGLTGADVHYPLFIDPNYDSTAASKKHWTYVSSAFPTTNYLDTSDVARAGYQGWSSPFGTARSFFMFNIPSSIWNSVIHTATLQTKEVWSATSTAFTMNVNHISTSSTAISGSTTWNNQPTKGALIDSTSAPGNWSAGGEGAVSPKEVDFDVTDEITSAASGHWSTDTIGLYNSTETNRDAWRKFQNNPTIAITYDRKPNTPSSVATSPKPTGGLIGNTGVTFQATLSDPDGTQNPLTATFKITDTNTGVTTTLTKVVSSGQVAKVEEPATFFTDAHDYTWTVNAWDTIAFGATTTGAGFKIDKSAPAAPTIASPYDTDGTPLPPRTATTFTISDTGQNPTTYYWSLSGSAWTSKTAAADGAATTVSITPPGTGPYTLSVYAVDSAGNPSATTVYQFMVAQLPQPDVFGDFDGDGKPDLLRVGSAASPGLWLYKGTGTTGAVSTVGKQVGSRGTGFAGSSGKASDWTGTSIAYGDFNNDGAQDIMVMFPTTNPNGSNLEIVPGTGDGATFNPQTAIPVDLPTIDTTGMGDQSVTSIAAAPDNQCDPGIWSGSGLLATPVDLYATVGDSLYLYVPASFDGSAYDLADVGGDCPGALVSGLAGSTGWGARQLTAAPTAAASPPSVVTRSTAGAVDRWVGTAYDTANAVAGTAAGAAGGAHTAYSSPSLAPGTYPSVMGVDVDANEASDLWAVTAAGVNAYVDNGVGGFSAPIMTAPLRFSALPDADMTVDGIADIVGVDTAGGLWLYPGTGGTGLAAVGPRTKIGTSGWTGFQVSTVDWDGDGAADIVAVDTSGTLWLYPNTDINGTATTGSRQQKGVGWGSYTMAAGNVDRDGHGDLFGINNSTGELNYYPDGTNKTLVGHGGWTGYRIYVADFDNDGRGDIIAIDTSGVMWFYPNTGGTGLAMFGARVQLNTGWTSYKVTTADINNDGRLDIVAMDPSGNVWDYANSGNNTLLPRVQIASGWTAAGITTIS